MRLRTQLLFGLAIAAGAVSLATMTLDAPTQLLAQEKMSDAIEVTQASDATASADAAQPTTTEWLPIDGVRMKVITQPGAANLIPLANAQMPRDRAKMSNAVASLAAAGGDGHVDIIVSYDTLPSVSDLRDLDARVMRDFPRLNMAQVTVPASSLNAFSVQGGVSLMSLDEPIASASSASKSTAGQPGKDSDWNVSVASDVRVAVLDSGISDMTGVNVATRMDCTAGWAGSTRNYRDDFDSRVVSGNDGADVFLTPWIENGESDGVTSGALEIGNAYGVCLSGYCMEVEGFRQNVSYTRQLDLKGSAEAKLTYVASVDSGNGGVAVVEVSADGVAWHTLASYALGNTLAQLTESFDITAYSSDATTLRIRVTQAEDSNHMGVLGIDNLRVDASIPEESCVAAAPQQTVVAGNLLDEFNQRSFANNNGSISFASDWHEVGESDGPSTGALEVDDDHGVCLSGECIQIEAIDTGDALVRSANLANASAAQVNYVYSNMSTYGGAVAFEVSADGGRNWSTLAMHDINHYRDHTAVSFDVTPWLSDDMQLRFRVDQAHSWGKIGIDNFEIKVSAADVDAYDQFGHGTHVAGIIGGMESGTLAEDGGVAPDARIVSVRVLDGEGRGVTSDVMAGLDWVIANAEAEKIRVVNLSLGKAVTESADTDPLVAAAEAVWDAGIVVIASAGNYGRDGHFTITSPGNSPKLITVGSLTDSGTNDISDDYVSTYSSRGPTSLDNYLKPDLLAPGNAIISTASSKSKMSKDLPANNKGHDRLELSGTSMAAAMTSGTAALMLSADSSLTPATIKARLMRSARKIDENPTAAGAGVLDIEAALAETGVMTREALSPRMARSTQSDVILVENTAQLWGDATWGAGFLWTDGDSWAQGYLWTDADISANGFLWTDAGLQSNGFLWTDGGAWANGYLWTDEGMWANGFLWTDTGSNANALYKLGALKFELNDD